MVHGAVDVEEFENPREQEQRKPYGDAGVIQIEQQINVIFKDTGDTERQPPTRQHSPARRKPCSSRKEGPKGN